MAYLTLLDWGDGDPVGGHEGDEHLFRHGLLYKDDDWMKMWILDGCRIERRVVDPGYRNSRTAEPYLSVSLTPVTASFVQDIWYRQSFTTEHLDLLSAERLYQERGWVE